MLKRIRQPNWYRIIPCSTARFSLQALEATPRRDKGRTMDRTPREEVPAARPASAAISAELAEGLATRLDAISSDVHAAATTTASALAAAAEQLSELLQRVGSMDARLASVESRLAGAGAGSGGGDGETQRKRKHTVSLKRFEDAEDRDGGGWKDAPQHGSLGDVTAAPGWVAQTAAAVFGIEAADLSRGREGSRLIHPTSPFVSGAAPY